MRTGSPLKLGQRALLSFWICAGLFAACVVPKLDADVVVDTFDTGTQGQMVPGGNIWWGSSTMTWDGTQDATGNGGGSAYITCTFSSASDTPCMADITLGLGGNNPWWCPVSIDLSGGSIICILNLDIKQDVAASTMSVAQFNHPGLWDPGITGSYDGMEFGLFDINPNRIPITVMELTNAAAAGWVHMSVPIDPRIPGINDTRGFYLHKWFAGTPTGTGVFAFWMDNLLISSNEWSHRFDVKLSVHPAPQGLNLFAATTGQYDRESIEVQPGSGIFSWLGSSGVTYAFTLSQFEARGPGQQVHLFLIPNAGTGTAPDWDAANAIFVTLQNQKQPNGDPYYVFQFAYKTNQPGTNSMFYSSNLLYGKCLTNGTAVGTWSVMFVNDTTVRLSGPGGISTNFTAFDQASANLFADPVYVFFGMQPNSATNAGFGHVVLTSVGVSGPNVTPVFDDFSSGGSPVGPTGGYAGLNTNLWVTRLSAPGAGQSVPANAWFMNWGLPDTGYRLATNSDMANPAGWSTTNLPLKWQVGETNYVMLTTNDNFDIYQVPGTALDSTGTNTYSTNYWYHYPLGSSGPGNLFISLKK